MSGTLQVDELQVTPTHHLTLGSDSDKDCVNQDAHGSHTFTRIVSECPLQSFRGGGQKYEVQCRLGEGAYGAVYQCTRACDGAEFAVKIVDPRKMAFAIGSVTAQEGLEIMVNREVEALRRLSAHPGIVTIEVVMWSAATRQTFIVTELVRGETLFPLVFRRTERFKEAEVAHVAAQVSNALAFCHSQRVAHRDIKLENVLVAAVDVDLVQDETGCFQTCEFYEVKLCDFGLAKVLQGPNTTRTAVGTTAYSAPEIEWKERRGYDAMKADAYSYGVMVFVMLCLDFPGKEQTCAYANNKHWPTLSPQAKSFLSSLLEPNPEARLSMAQASGRQWLAEAQAKRTEDLKHHEVEFEVAGRADGGSGATNNTVVIGDSPGTGASDDADSRQARHMLSVVDEDMATGALGRDTITESIPVGKGAVPDDNSTVRPSFSISSCGCRQGLKQFLQSIVDRL